LIVEDVDGVDGVDGVVTLWATKAQCAVLRGKKEAGA